MRVLLVYLMRKWTTPEYFKKTFERITEVEVFDFGNTPYWGDFRFKLPFYIPKGFPVSIQSVIKKLGKNFNLIIEVTTSGQYHLTGYKRLRNAFPELKVVLWALDVYRFDQRKFMLWMKDDFDYIFVSQKKFVDIFKPIKSYWLPYAADPEIHKKFNMPKIYDVVFVGNTNPQVYPERVKLLELIKREFNLKIFQGIFGEDLAMVYSQSKIVFNKSAAGELNMRVFEAMSCGSLLLTDRLDPEAGLEDLFQDKKHLVLYDNTADLLEKIDYYLKHEDEREEIAYQGYNEVLAKHTYEHRAKEMLEKTEFCYETYVNL